jgi:ATP-dependent RNA helicase DDX56/DBP9
MTTTKTDHHLLDDQVSFQVACKSLGLDVRLAKAIAKLGFVYPTLVQAKCLPFALEGKDVLVHARTGSGKTAAYCLPILQKILLEKSLKSSYKKGVRALILVPTRELCGQVLNQLEQLCYYCKDDITSLSFASESLDTQKAWLRENPDIIISTPLRAAKHLAAGNFNAKTITTLIVDEADLVLSYGYANDVKSVVEKLPKTCQSLLMSATLSDDLEKLKKVVLRNPVILRLEMGKRDGQLKQFYLSIPKDDKDLLLYAFIKLGVITGKALFFVNDVEACYRKKLIMEQFGIHAAVLNSELPFNSRQHIIKEFNKGVFDILIATDDSLGMEEEEEENDEEESSSSDNSSDEEEEEEDADSSKTKKSNQKSTSKNDKEYGVSRGVDFHGVTFVLNIDFPKSPEAYTHRIGRTARGGASGTAISFVEDDNMEELKILKLVQDEQPRLNSKTANSTADNNNDEDGDTLQGEGDDMLCQPAFFDFKIEDLEGFRYRMDDVKRAVTKVAVRDARVRELKQEMINSERLKDHFKENPQDLQILQHAGTLRPHLIKKHLAHVPDYLLPADMKPKKTNFGNKRKRKRKKTNGANNYSSASQRKNKNAQADPLQSFTYESQEGNDDDDGDDGSNNGDDEEEKPRRATTNEFETTGRHKEWQRRHGKGKFSKKYDKTRRRKKRKGINQGFQTTLQVPSVRKVGYK